MEAENKNKIIKEYSTLTPFTKFLPIKLNNEMEIAKIKFSCTSCNMEILNARFRCRKTENENYIIFDGIIVCPHCTSTYRQRIKFIDEKNTTKMLTFINHQLKNEKTIFERKTNFIVDIFKKYL